MKNLDIKSCEKDYNFDKVWRQIEMWEIWVEMELRGAKDWFYYTVPAILNSLVTEILQTSSVLVPGTCI